jgi:IS605 OrfB family transposase
MTFHENIRKGLSMISQIDDKLLNTSLGQLQINIYKHSKLYALPTNPTFNDVKTNSWFDIKKADNLNFTKHVDANYDKIEHDQFYTKQYKLRLTDLQSKIMDKWVDAYTMMYNETVSHLNYRSNNNLPFLKLGDLKKQMKISKDKVTQLSEMTIKTIDKKGDTVYRKVYINSHSLDYAINDAILRVTAAITNLKRGNINFFRLRKKKLTKPNKIMKLEKSAFGKNAICRSVLGEVLCDNNEDDFSYLTNMTTISIIKKIGKEYYLLKKYKFEKGEKEEDKNSTIGIDLGIRTALTGYSNKDVIEIGNTGSLILEKKLKVIDSISKKKFKKKKERKIVKKKYKKITNMISDMHFKVSNYLTDNYKNIIVGNLSTQKICKGKSISKMTKRKGYILSFYKFKMILKYMCERKGNNYKEMDEQHTTQCCGKCGNQKKNVGGAHVYICTKCGLKIGRDINSARLMIIKSEK